MKIGIQLRLICFILFLIGFVAGAMVFLFENSFDQGLLHFISRVEKRQLGQMVIELEQAYQKNKSWEFLQQDQMSWYRMVVETLGPDEDHEAFLRRHEKRIEEGKQRNREGGSKRVSSKYYRRLLLLDSQKNLLQGRAEYNSSKAILLPVRYNQKVVGYAGLMPAQYLSESLHIRFSQEQEKALWFIALAVVVLAVCFSVPVANNFANRIKKVAQTTERLTKGELSARVDIDNTDEIGQLALNFNTLAVTLEQNEQLRKQWLADISHDLRTPITILRGEIEAMQDGLREVTSENLNILHNEIMQLNKLISDLHAYSILDIESEHTKMSRVDLVSILQDTLRLYRSRFAEKNIGITDNLDRLENLFIYGNLIRLNQLFVNLLENSYKYTGNGGKVSLQLAVRDDRIIILLQDSAPGVTEDELEKLFDRFYRTDKSRNRQTGGTGLGLSICMKIVRMHGGDIWAHSSTLGGLEIKVEFPSYETTNSVVT